MIKNSWWLSLGVGLTSLVLCPAVTFAGSCAQYSAPILQQKAAPYQGAIALAARKYAISPALITSVIASESCFRDAAISHKGAKGLMQLMPATAADMGTSNALDPYENIDAGSRYLAYLLQRYNGSLTHAIAAYNAGMGRVEANTPVNVPYAETKGYVRNVLTALSTLEPNPQANLYVRRTLANWQQGNRNAVPRPVFQRAVATQTATGDCDRLAPGLLQQTERQGKGRYSAFFYVVKAGETMQDVAGRFGKDKLSVLRLNPVSHDYEPMAGHRLKVAECLK